MVGIVCCSLWIFFSLIFLVSPLASHSQAPILTPFAILKLPGNTTGPESIAFAPKLPHINNIGPYTGISDGRIVQFSAVNGGFIDFATTAPNRSKSLCNGKSDPSLERICGRPLGLCFNRLIGMLLVVDAYHGLFMVPPDGGKAKLLAATDGDGVPFRFLNAVDVNPLDGSIYIIESSMIYERRQIEEAIKARDTTGRLLKYNPQTKTVTTLLKNLSGPAGVAVSINGGFLVLSEIYLNRTLRYWLKGPRNGQKEVFANLPGLPDNMKRNERGEFWVAINNGTASFGQKFNSLGRLLRTVIFNTENPFSFMSISEVHEYKDKFYVGSIISRNVLVFQY